MWRRSLRPGLDSWLWLLLGVLVGVSSLAPFDRVGDFRHRHFPPASAFSGGAIGIGFDTDEIGAIRSASARHGRFELGNGLHILRQRAERCRVRGEVDAWRAIESLHAIVEEIVDGLAATGLLGTIGEDVAQVAEASNVRFC